jgi:hypothetical protein
MKRYGQLFCLLPLGLAIGAAQTTVSLRASGPAGYVITGATNETPLVVQTASPHGLQAGDKVVNWGVGATVSGACVASTANGIRVVKNVVDVTHFSVADTAGADVAANGAWCDGAVAPDPAGAAAGGKLTDFQLAPLPRVFVDGPAGPTMRKLALGTNNGLVSLVVSGGVATATTGYPHGVVAGDKIAVWGSTTAALTRSGAPYTVSDVTGTTFRFPAPGVADATYSGRDQTCGPAADQDCLRISQLAYTGNPWWNTMTSLTDQWKNGSVTYKHKFDGGNFGVSGSPEQQARAYGNAAVHFLVDPSDKDMLNVAKYCVNSLERIGGVNWTGVEAEAAQGGNSDLNDFGSYAVEAAAICYTAARDYLRPEERRQFADKLYNDIDQLNPAPCDKSTNLPVRKVLASGTSRAGSPTTITLAANDPAPQGYYVNNVILAMVGTSRSYGLVTAYDAAAKTATVGSWTGGAPVAGSVYTIYATITISSAAGAVAATVTGYNTHFTADIAAGNAIMGSNGWQVLPEAAQSFIKAVNSDTSLSVTNSLNVSASTSTPQIAWVFRHWQPGACGLRWLQNHWGGAMGALPSLYPSGGGVQAAVHTGAVPPQMPVLGGNNGYTRVTAWMQLDMAMADDDPRAITDLAIVQSQWWDWHMRHTWNFATGMEHSGASYSAGRVLRDGPAGMIALANSAPAFPPMDVGGNWIMGDVLWKMYGIYPDRRVDVRNGNQVPWPTRYGTENSDNALSNDGEIATAYQMAPAFTFQPNGAATRYYLSFLKSWPAMWGRTYNHVTWEGLLRVDPRIKPLDFAEQPKQRLFQATSRDTACVLTGWPCPASYRADGVISHTGWNDRTATQVFFNVKTYYTDHDAAEGGSLRIYKVGHLLNSDTMQPGGAIAGIKKGDIIDTLPLFGGVTSLQSGQDGTGIPATANIVRWASANHGGWDSGYGDGQSRYAYALADLAGNYIGTHDRVQRHFAHFKKPGTEEIVMQFDDIDTSSAPTQIETHIHYTQNGQTRAGIGVEYDEGDTACPGAGGCAALNTDRLILSQENGGTSAADPPRTNGLVTRIFSPGAIFVRDDGSSYAGGFGHTHRVSICGASSCGAPSSRLEALVVHKVTGSLSDVTLTAKALNPDIKWTGAQTLDKVALFARNGQAPINANVVTDHGGIAQYLIAGFQPGLIYRVYRNDDGTDVIRQGVSDNDGTLYFEAPAGSYSIFPEGLSNLFLRAAMPAPRVGAAFRYVFATGAAATQFRCTIVAGSLPRGLSLSDAGVLSGTPAEAAPATFTVKAQSLTNPTSFATEVVTLTVLPEQLGLAVNAVTASRAILRYGRRGLDAGQRCGVTISDRADFASPLETASDNGGAARRLYVVGGVGTLAAATQYYARVVCGAGEAEASFVTAPSSFAPPAVRITAAPPRPGVASLEVQYGPTVALGSAVSVPCPGPCAVDVPLPAGGVAYIRRRYLDGSLRVLAESSIVPAAAAFN